jgi:hypothetical protein
LKLFYTDISLKCLKTIEVLTNFLNFYIMLKNILKLEGAQKLTKNEQKSLIGGILRGCPAGTHQCEESGPYRCVKNGMMCP